MIWQPTSSTRTDTLFPLTTLFRSYDGLSRFVCKLYNVVFLHCMQRWVNIMYAAVDNRGIDMQPVRDHNLGWVWFFMLFMILGRSEENTSEIQSLKRISYVVFCLKNTITQITIFNDVQ